MLTDKQKKQVETMIQGREGYLTSAQIAKRLGLTKSYVDDYLANRK